MGMNLAYLLNSPDTERIASSLESIAIAQMAGVTELNERAIQQIVRSGKAAKFFNIGDQIVVKWSDGTNEYDMPFDIVDFSNAINADGDSVPAMWLESHYCLPGTQFDGSESMYIVGDTALPAGTYYWTFGNTWGSIDVVENGAWNFTLEQDVPAGGCIVVHGTSGDGIYTWGAPDVAATTWRVSTFASPSDVTPIETVTVSSGATGTSLGILKNNTTYTTEPGINQLQRAAYGYNRWSQSALRQYLNSAAAAGAWWEPKNPYDRPPKQLETMRGFMAGLPAEFVDIITPIKVTTALNTVTDGGTSTGGTEDTIDRFFLPSLQQRYIVPQLNNAEGAAWQYWRDMIGTDDPWPTGSNNKNPKIIKYLISNHSSAQNSRLRSAYRGDAYFAWRVYSTGYAGYGHATSTLGFAPACVIC